MTADISELRRENAPRFEAPEQQVPLKGRRVLVADDSPVMQDLLQLVLSERGHFVETASDGEEALQRLSQERFDVALMDFHLPRLNGLEVVSRTREGAQDAPRFVAITSDVKGLLGDAEGCEQFDDVIPKPFDVADVFAAIERGGAVLEPESTVGASVDPSPARVSEPPPRRLARWPDDFTDPAAAAFLADSLAEDLLDAVVLERPATLRDMSALWTWRGLHLLPVIDMTGALRKHADFDGSARRPEDDAAIDRLIRAFRLRRRELHTDLIQTDDIAEKLIGRMLVSGGRLTVDYDASDPSGVSYGAMMDARSVNKEIKDLRARGLVEGAFFDRFHACRRCGSSRLNVREECADCGSPDLREESYLHHFRCAYQGPESDFRDGDDLRCPKCRRALTHFSVDYDRPGSMMVCRACGEAESEPDVGFVCLDCGAHETSEAIAMRDVESFVLTADGRDFTRAGRALLEGRAGVLRFGELPLPLLVALNAAIKERARDKTDFALLCVVYENGREIELREGVRLLEQSRDMLLDNLRRSFRSEDAVVKGHAYDFALVRGMTPQTLREELTGLRRDVIADIRADLGVRFDVYGPEDFC